MSDALTEDDVHSLSAACALDLANFRRSHLVARVAKALTAERVSSVAELRDRITLDHSARSAFRRSVAISVTSMFRDAEQFDALADVLRDLPPPTRPVRAWSAGCSTGEEVWTIAATLARTERAAGATVLGSDVLAENVQAARTLQPTVTDLRGMRLPSDLQLRFECRDIARQGPPGVAWDLVLCRNVAIYLDEEQRHAVHRTLASAVAQGGLLMLGRSERLGDPAALGLERLRPHIYRRVA